MSLVQHENLQQINFEFFAHDFSFVFFSICFHLVVTLICSTMHAAKPHWLQICLQHIKCMWMEVCGMHFACMSAFIVQLGTPADCPPSWLPCCMQQCVFVTNECIQHAASVMSHVTACQILWPFAQLCLYVCVCLFSHCLCNLKFIVCPQFCEKIEKVKISCTNLQ